MKGTTLCVIVGLYGTQKGVSMSVVFDTEATHHICRVWRLMILLASMDFVAAA